MSYPAVGRIYRKQRYAYRSTGITLRNPAALAGSIGNDENRYPAREARKISGELSSGQVSPNGATTSGGSVFRFEPVPAVTRPQRLRFIRAIGRMFRPLDRLKTVEKRT